VVGVWQTLQSFFYYLELNSMMDEIIMVETLQGPEDLRKSFMGMAQDRAIPLIPEVIQIKVEDTDKKTVAGAMIDSEWIKQTNRLLTIDLYYQAQIFFFSKRYVLHREKIFSQASLETPALPDLDSP
jgi:hypothetical protein